MSKLLQRLSDASRSGVYRASCSDEILDAADGSTLRVATVSVAGAADKSELLGRFARALEQQYFAVRRVHDDEHRDRQLGRHFLRR